MKKHIFKHIVKNLYEIIHLIYSCSEMEYAIDPENTPAPYYGSVKKLLIAYCKKYGYTKIEFYCWLASQMFKWRHPFKHSPYYDLYYYLHLGIENDSL